MVNKSNRKRRKSRLRKTEVINGFLFALPVILGLLVFKLGPMVASLILSFTRYNVLQPLEWIGLGNFQKVFSDPLFWTSLYNTAYFTFISVPGRLAIALLLAMLLNQKLKGIALFRTLYYIPSLASGVAVAVLWMWVLNPSYGILNVSLGYLGLKGPVWLGSEEWSKPALILMSFWAVGDGMIVYLAGLQGIPQQLYEVAEIDGANVWKKFRYVTIPMLTPVIFFNLIMGVIRAWQLWVYAYVMTEGGPVNSTLFYVLYLYRNAFEYFKMGYASTMAWILSLIIIGFTLLIFKSSPIWVFYAGEIRKK